MAKTFYDWWTEAKVKFEYAAGKKLERQNNIHKRRGKDGREAETRMKKPTTKGTFGRNKVGIGEAAKGLDKALLQTGGWKKRNDALKAFSEKAKAYAQQLDGAKNGEYNGVTVEIDALKKDLRAIETRFRYLITDQISLDTIIGAGTLPTTWVDLRAAFNKAVDTRDALKEYPTELRSLEDLQSRFSEALQASYWKARTSLLDFRDKVVKKIDNVGTFQPEWVEEKKNRVATELSYFALNLKQAGLDDAGMLAKIKSEQKRFEVKLTRPHNDKKIDKIMVDEVKCRALCSSGVADLLDSLDKWVKDVQATLKIQKAKVQQLKKLAGIR